MVTVLTQTQLAASKVFLYLLLLFLLGVLHLDVVWTLTVLLGLSMVELVISWWRES